MANKDIVNQLRMNSECLAPSIMLDAADEIERLRRERDEARREVCEWEHHWDKTSSEQYYADKRGWDCFKQEDGK
jgi:hypothetical protein